MSRHFDRIAQTMKRQRPRLGGSILEYVCVALIFIVLSLCYTRFSVFSGDNTLFISEIGDGTAGVTWSMYADKDLNPLYGHTNLVNYPEGADLGNPSQITSILAVAPLWLLSRFMSSFMATNVTQLLAYLLMSMSTYFVAKRLTGKWYVAFFAGFAATYFPYLLYKSVNHLDYIFSWVFAFQLGAFLYLWARPSWKSSLLAALSIAAGYFTDGYFLLISTVFAATIFIGLMLSNVIMKLPWSRYRQFLKYCALSLGMLMLLALPIVATRITQGNGIEKTLDRSTSTIKYELSVFASTKLDFLTPPENPIFKGMPWYERLVERRNAYPHSNSVESNVYIGYVVLLLCVLGVVMFVVLLAKKRWIIRHLRLTVRDQKLLVVLSCIVIVTIPVILSFMGPDRIYKFGLSIPTLAGILTDHIALWRVLARFILPLHLLLVVYAAFVLYLILKPLHTHKKKEWIAVVVVALATGVCVVEYATTINTQLFDLRKMPAVYRYLKSRDDIEVIGELPLQDDVVNAYYPTAQYVHGKKLINNHISVYNIGQFSTLGTEQNPDTIDFMKKRGADAIITRDKQCTAQPWGSLLFSEKVNLKSMYEAPLLYFQSGNDWVCLYKLDNAKMADPSFVTTSAAFGEENTGYYTTALRDPWVTMKIADAEQNLIKDRRATLSVEAFSTGKLPYAWVMKQGSRTVATGRLQGPNHQIITADVDTNQEVRIDFTLLDKDIKYVHYDIRLLNYVSTLLPAGQ